MKEIKGVAPVAIAVVIIVVVIVAVGAWYVTRLPAEEEEEPVHLIWGAGPDVASIPIRVALEKGYFEDEGVDVELQTFGMGINTMDQIIAGQMDIGIGGSWALMLRLGKPNLMLGAFWGFRTLPVEIWAAPGIDNLSDLKGKRLGTVQGTQEHMYFYYALDKGGVGYNEVEWAYYGAMVDGVAVALRGDIDAAWFYEKSRTMAIDQLAPLGWHAITTQYNVMPMSFLLGSLILPVSQSTVEEHPEAIAAAFRAYMSAIDWVRTFPDQAVKLALDEGWVVMSESDLKTMILGFTWYLGLQKDYVEAMMDAKDWALANGFLKEDYNFADRVAIEPVMIAAPEYCTFNPADY